MWTLVAFFLAAVIGLVVVLAVGRGDPARSKSSPWILHDTAREHVGVTAGLAGFALTGVVLVVTLAHDRPATAGGSLDTVIVMFLVAYLWWVGSAFLISYIPHNKLSGELGSVLNKDSSAHRIVIQGFRIGGGLDEEATVLAEQ
jgi:hypothetical protein